MALHDCAGASLWSSDVSCGPHSASTSICAHPRRLESLSLPQCVPSGVLGRPPSCVVVSGLGVSAGSTVHGLLMRCRPRGYVQRSKLVQDELWVQLRTHEQAQRVLCHLRHFFFLLVLCFLVNFFLIIFGPSCPFNVASLVVYDITGTVMVGLPHLLWPFIASAIFVCSPRGVFFCFVFRWVFCVLAHSSLFFWFSWLILVAWYGVVVWLSSS